MAGEKLYFFARSAAAPAGKNKNDYIRNGFAYQGLDAIDAHWRRILAPADASCGPFTYDGHSFDSIEHAILYVKAKKSFPALVPEYSTDKAHFLSRMAAKKISDDGLDQEYVNITKAKLKACKLAREVLLGTHDAELWLIRHGTAGDIRLTWLEQARSEHRQSKSSKNNAENNEGKSSRFQVELVKLGKKDKKLANAPTTLQRAAGAKVQAAMTQRERALDRKQVEKEVQKENKSIMNKEKEKKSAIHAMGKMLSKLTIKPAGQHAEHPEEISEATQQKWLSLIKNTLLSSGASASQATQIATDIVLNTIAQYGSDEKAGREKILSINSNMKKKPDETCIEDILAHRLISGEVTAQQVVAMSAKDYYPSYYLHLDAVKDRKEFKLSLEFKNGNLNTSVAYSTEEAADVLKWKHGYAYNLLQSMLTHESEEETLSILEKIATYAILAHRHDTSVSLEHILEAKTIRVIDRLRSHHGGMNGLTRMRAMTKGSRNRFIIDA